MPVSARQLCSRGPRRGTIAARAGRPQKRPGAVIRRQWGLRGGRAEGQIVRPAALRRGRQENWRFAQMRPDEVGWRVWRL